MKLEDRHSLLMSATTSLGSKVVSQHSALLAPLAVDAVLKVIDPLKDHDVDLRVRIIYKDYCRATVLNMIYNIFRIFESFINLVEL